jgi:hypothetical protein
MKTTPSELKRSIHFNKDVIPVRIRAIHFINAPNIFLSLFNMLKSMLPHKFIERVSYGSQFFFVQLKTTKVPLKMAFQPCLQLDFSVKSVVLYNSSAISYERFNNGALKINLKFSIPLKMAEIYWKMVLK